MMKTLLEYKVSLSLALYYWRTKVNPVLIRDTLQKGKESDTQDRKSTVFEARKNEFSLAVSFVQDGFNAISLVKGPLFFESG